MEPDVIFAVNVMEVIASVTLHKLAVVPIYAVVLLLFSTTPNADKTLFVELA